MENLEFENSIIQFSSIFTKKFSEKKHHYLEHAYSKAREMVTIRTI